MSRIDLFFDVCRIGTLLHRCGISKMRGASPTAIVWAIFALPFLGINSYCGIAFDEQLEFRKDAAYELLRANWRRFLLLLSAMLCRAVKLFTGEERGKVLVIDDSSYGRRHSRRMINFSCLFFLRTFNISFSSLGNQKAERSAAGGEVSH
jgi:hypothetical protein